MMLTNLRLWLIIAAVAGAFGLLAYASYERHRADGIQADYDRYKLEIARATSAELARQKREGEAAIAQLNLQLQAAEKGRAAAEQDADARQAEIDARPKVAGRGATKEDADAFNR
jgi:hypothetical protein